MRRSTLILIAVALPLVVLSIDSAWVVMRPTSAAMASRRPMSCWMSPPSEPVSVATSALALAMEPKVLERSSELTTSEMPCMASRRSATISGNDVSVRCNASAVDGMVGISGWRSC